jgi:hypothetical protein
MYYPASEMTLSFIILICLSMTISCLKLRYQNSLIDNMQDFFGERIESKHYGAFWKFMYLTLRHIHIVVLLWLFLVGFENMYCARNLGYMFFFTVYTASETLYRKTNVMLLVFNSSFLWG